MLLNNLDPEVAEHPERLVVYGGTGRAARSHEALREIVRTLLRLRVRRDVARPERQARRVFRTGAWAPRVLIANSLLVPRWATWDEFRRLEAEGLTMFGQMTAGSWIYIGTQGILQGTYQTFAAAGEQHFGSPDLSGRTILTAGLGGMGGAQPLAATMAGAAILCVEVDASRIRAPSRDAVPRRGGRLARRRARARTSRCFGRTRALGRATRQRRGPCSRSSSPRGEHFDLVTDQTAAHDPLTGYVPAEVPFEEAAALRERDPESYLRLARESIVAHVRAMTEFAECRLLRFRLRQQPARRGPRRRTRGGLLISRVRPGLHQTALLSRHRAVPVGGALRGPCRHRRDRRHARIALSRTTRCSSAGSSSRPGASRSRAFRRASAGSGTATARERALAINELVRSGEVSAPVVIGRDHLDAGSVASPFRETEAMRDGSDAIADWPILNALVNVAAGATWVSVHHGGGVGIGNSIHAGMVVVADGTDEAAERLERVLTTDPGMGVVRHADAGYEEALATARAYALDLPSVPATRRERRHGRLLPLLIRDLAQVASPAGSGAPLRGAALRAST